MKIFLLLLTFTAIAFYEAPGLIRRKQWRELTAFAALLTIGFVFNLLQVIGVKIPNPTKIIVSFSKYITKITKIFGE